MYDRSEVKIWKIRQCIPVSKQTKVTTQFRIIIQLWNSVRSGLSFFLLTESRQANSARCFWNWTAANSEGTEWGSNAGLRTPTSGSHNQTPQCFQVGHHRTDWWKTITGSAALLCSWRAQNYDDFELSRRLAEESKSDIPREKEPHYQYPHVDHGVERSFCLCFNRWCFSVCILECTSRWANGHEIITT